MSENAKRYGRIGRVGPTLLRLGYLPIPIRAGQKRPTLENWTQLRATPDLLTVWDATDPAGNVGLLTKHTPFIDNDIRDPELSALMRAEVELMLTGPLCVRVGSAPKHGILCRTDTPFPKVSTGIWLDVMGEEYLFEILADGQQFVASGIHPGTKKPYVWEDPERTPAKVPASDLPLLTLAMAEELRDIALALFQSRGFVRKAKGTSLSTMNRANYDADDIVHDDGKISDLTDEQLEERLRLLSWESMDYDTWTNVCAAMRHQWSDDPARGEALWLELSAADPRFNEKQALEKWKSFKRNTGGNAKTMRYVLELTKEAWEKARPQLTKEDKKKYGKAMKIALKVADTKEEISTEDLIAELAKDETLKERAEDEKNLSTIERLLARAREMLGDKPWLNQLLVSPVSGMILGSVANVLVTLKEDPAWADVVAFNEFTREVVKLRPLPIFNVDEFSADYVEPVPFKSPEMWSEHDDTDVRVYMHNAGIMASSDDVKIAVRRLAIVKPFHPVRDAMRALKWDGKKRLDTWMTVYMNAKPGPYTSGVGRMFLISFVARIMRPGCKVDHMLVLESPGQGEGKSSACAIIAGDETLFSDKLPNIGDDDVRTSMALRGKTLIEMGELDTLRKAQMETIKNFISGTVEDYVPKHAKSAVREPRGCVFIGTTNREDYLKDETGNRRFWPVKVKDIQFAALIRDRDQIIAEALAAFEAGEQWHPTKEFQTRYADPEQALRLEVDDRSTPVLRWMQKRLEDGYPVVRVTGAEVWSEALSGSLALYRRQEQMIVGAILRGLGFVPKNNGKERSWLAPPSSPQLDPAWDL